MLVEFPLIMEKALINFQICLKKVENFIMKHFTKRLKERSKKLMKKTKLCFKSRLKVLRNLKKLEKMKKNKENKLEKDR